MDSILKVQDLRVSFRTDNGKVQAVRDISFDLERGKTLAIVGESGSGKSVTSKAILGILAGNAIVESGKILYDGKDLLKISEEEMCSIRGDKISMIFQDPLSALNPIVRIGKQITETMIIKNKATKKRARKEFNSTLACLKTNMTAALGDQAKVAKACETFDKFNMEGIKLEDSYNKAFNNAEELPGKLADFLFKCEKHQSQDVKGMLKEFAIDLKGVKDPFLTKKYDAKLADLAARLDKARKGSLPKPRKDGTMPDMPAKLIACLTEIKSVTEEIAAQTRPDFFRIGYYAMKHPGEDLTGRDVAQLNQMCLEFLDRDFMLEFLDMETKGLKHSFDAALEKKQALLAELAQAHDYYAAGGYTKADALKKGKELAAKVQDSIDPLELNKDSTAYTFGTSLESAIEKYFDATVKNPKEEARFAKQTKKREALIAKGKTVDWKVVPKQIYDLEALKSEIVEVIDNMAGHYREYIADAPSVDFEKRSIEMVDYLKEKASQVVYTVTPSMAKETAIKLMEEVGIPEPRVRYTQYPFEFSGGMRQRIVIAIALAANPDILICDEPTTALDVTIQAQILELINDLKRERNLSVIFITHDLGVVANMADDIAVMYAGKIVEYGTADDIFYDPRHPYTWALLSSMPDLDTKEKLDAIPGTPPNMIYPPVGDAFAERNKYAMEIDFEAQPPQFRVSDTHWAATWLLHPDAPKVAPPKIITDRIARMKKKAGGAQDCK